MKIKPQWLLLVIVTVFLCWIGWRTQAQSSAKDSWEYLVIPTVNSVKGNSSNINLNELGAQGWELVTSGTVEHKGHENYTYSTHHLYFKRKR